MLAVDDCTVPATYRPAGRAGEAPIFAAVVLCQVRIQLGFLLMRVPVRLGLVQDCHLQTTSVMTGRSESE